MSTRFKRVFTIVAKTQTFSLESRNIPVNQVPQVTKHVILVIAIMHAFDCDLHLQIFQAMIVLKFNDQDYLRFGISAIHRGLGVFRNRWLKSTRDVSCIIHLSGCVLIEHYVVSSFNFRGLPKFEKSQVRVIVFKDRDKKGDRCVLFDSKIAIQEEARQVL